MVFFANPFDVIEENDSRIFSWNLTPLSPPFEGGAGGGYDRTKSRIHDVRQRGLSLETRFFRETGFLMISHISDCELTTVS